jgi:D-xylose transport system substrate-binding protein
VSVWKDARELGRAAGEIAVQLAGGTAPTEIEGVQAFTTPGGNDVSAIFLAPQPITQENLSVVVDAGWITQEELCQGVTGGPAPCE